MNRWITCLGLIVAAAMPLAADEIVLNGQAIEDATITAVNRNMVQFTSPTRSGLVPLSQISQITLDNQNNFNKAEQLASDGKIDEAWPLYVQARRDLKGVQQTLVDARMSAIRRRVSADVLAAAADGGEGAAQPAAPEDPFASPKALAAEMATKPQNPAQAPGWADLSAAERQQKLTAYQRELTTWNRTHRFVGRVVRWPLTIRSLKSAEGAPATVVAEGADGHFVQATVRTLPGAVSVGSKMLVTGTIAAVEADPVGDAAPEGATFLVTLRDASLAAADAGAGDGFDPPGVTDVVYVIDLTAAAGEAEPRMKAELLRALGRLVAEQNHLVMAVTGGEIKLFGPGRLSPSTRNNLVVISEAINKARAGGAGSVPDALGQALRLLRAQKGRVPAVYVLTAVPMEQNQPLTELLQSAGKENQPIAVRFLLFGSSDPDARRAFARFVADQGAKLRAVTD